MEQAKREVKDFFEEFGLELQSGEVEVGGTYPIFGMITKILGEEPGKVAVELNFNIVARLNIAEQENINLLKERAFESGIFVSTVVAKEPAIEVDCQTVIFGRKQGYQA
jgi:hypothetical protein